MKASRSSFKLKVAFGHEEIWIWGVETGWGDNLWPAHSAFYTKVLLTCVHAPLDPSSVLSWPRRELHWHAHKKKPAPVLSAHSSGTQGSFSTVTFWSRLSTLVSQSEKGRASVTKSSAMVQQKPGMWGGKLRLRERTLMLYSLNSAQSANEFMSTSLWLWAPQGHEVSLIHLGVPSTEPSPL